MSWIFGKDGYAPAWFVKLFAGHKLKKLVTMHGITDLQQRALFHLAQVPGQENLYTLKRFFETLVAHGALPVYDEDGNRIKYKRDELPTKVKTAHIEIPAIDNFKPYAADELNHLYRTGQISRAEYDRWK